jgi:hypothetical protein
MEFKFGTRSEAKESPFFFTDEECDNRGTAYGWKIVILDELQASPAKSESVLTEKESVLVWDAYCAALARRFARRDNPHLGYEDLFQEARLKVCILVADNAFPLAEPGYHPEDEYVSLSPEDEAALEPESRKAYRLLRDNIGFRSALRRALIDYVGKHG